MRNYPSSQGVRYLANTKLYQDEGIVLSDDWLKKMPSNKVDFVVDENDKELISSGANNIDNDDICEELLNPGGQQTLLFDFDNLQENEAIKYAPGEGQKPLSLLMDVQAEALSFPSIYCGVPRVMKETRITRTDIAKSDARNKDRRCAVPNKLLYSFKLAQTFQIAGQISMCLRKKKGVGQTTAGNLLNEDYVNNLVQHDDGYKLLKSIRSSPSYWEDKQKTLMAMIRQFGVPTFFITLSAAEVKWMELIVILKEVLEGVTISEAEAETLKWEEKADLIRRDPITCSRYFDYRLRQCNKYLLLNNGGIFKDNPVIDSFCRIEFQNRGSPHMHGLFWLKDSPKFNEEDEQSFEDCTDFIDKYISCESDTEGVIHQHHKHTSTCQVKVRGTAKCRFNMPYPPMRKTRILVPFPIDTDPKLLKNSKDLLIVIKDQIDYIHSREDSKEVLLKMNYEDLLEYLDISEADYIKAIRSGINRPTVFLKRRMRDSYFNAFNPELAKAWKANMDMQFILDPYACVKYCASYVSKSCRGMSELMKKVTEEVKSGNLTAKEKLKRFAHEFLKGSEVSAQEAAYSVLGMPLSRCSRDCVFINTGPVSERVKITKPVEELKLLPPNSTCVTVAGLLDHYTQRPMELESLTLSEFASWWTFSSKKPAERISKIQNLEEDEINDDEEEPDFQDAEEKDMEQGPTSYELLNETGYIKKRTKAKVIRFRNYGQLADPENYYRENCMLYYPWRNEEKDINEQNCQQIYQDNCQHMEEIKQDFDQRLDLSSIEAAIENPDDIEEEFLVDEEYEVLHDDEICQNYGMDIGCENNEKMNTLKMPGVLSDNEYNTLMSSLNDGQQKYHDHCVNNIRKLRPAFYEFVSGGAGVGKSVLITAITQTLMRDSAKVPGKDPRRLKVLLCAPTGVAAFNISGFTLHQAFHLPFTQYNGRMPKLTESNRNRMAAQIQDIDLIIIDEVSMMSREQLFQIDDRLRQIFKSNIDFGNKSILVVGDFYQLDPVMAQHIFAEPRVGKEILSCNYLWPKFQFYELLECMRQKEDKPFAEALNRIRVGQCTEDDVKMFKSREIAANNLSPPKSAMRLKYTNNDVGTYNVTALASFLEGVGSPANDRVQGTGSRDNYEAIRNAAKKLPIKKTQNLPLELLLKIGARYMMTVNADTSDGLVNGAIGKLRKISYGTTRDGQKVPVLIWMEFEKEVGRSLRSRQKRLLRSENITEMWIPIAKESRTIHSWPGRNLEVVRTQFAFVPAEAITTHKSQGSTFKEVVLSVEYKTDHGRNKRVPRRALYVGLSRCKTLAGLFIDGTFVAPEPPGPDDKIDLEMKKLRKRPVIFEDDDVKASTPISVEEQETLKEDTKRFCSPIITVKKEVLSIPPQMTDADIGRNNFFKLGDYFGSLGSICSLRTQSFINDEVMDAISLDLIQQSGQHSVFYIESNFMTISRLFPQVLADDLNRAYNSTIYIHLNPGGNHWILCEIKPAEGTIYTFDSLPALTEPYYSSLLNKLIENLKDVGIYINFPKFIRQRCALQSSIGNNCGIRSLLCMKGRLLGVSVEEITYEEAELYRMECAVKLLSSTQKGIRLMGIHNGNIVSLLNYYRAL